MSQNHPSVPDVGAILEALRAEVRAQRLARGTAAPSGIERELQRSLDEVELQRVVSAHWPLVGRTLPQRVVALINKVVRRYLRWYINPIVEQQNAYNDAVARCLRLLAEAYGDLADQGTGDRGQETADKEAPVPSVPTSSDEFQAAIYDPSASLRTRLQSAIQQRAASEPPARFPDLELQAAVVLLRLREQVSAHWPLPASTPLQRAIALVNKLVRRYLRWYINPIVEQQNSANAAITVALLNLVRLDAERRAEAAARRARDRVSR